LHLLNSPQIQARLSHDGGAVARLVRQLHSDDELVDELYLAFFSRYPDGDERQAAVAHLQASPAGRRKAAEDLAWSLLNSLEFVFNH
jgi:hypothetical protein